MARNFKDGGVYSGIAYSHPALPEVNRVYQMHNVHLTLQGGLKIHLPLEIQRVDQIRGNTASEVQKFYLLGLKTLLKYIQPEFTMPEQTIFVDQDQQSIPAEQLSLLEMFSSYEFEAKTETHYEGTAFEFTQIKSYRKKKREAAWMNNDGSEKLLRIEQGKIIDLAFLERKFGIELVQDKAQKKLVIPAQTMRGLVDVTLISHIGQNEYAGHFDCARPGVFIYSDMRHDGLSSHPHSRAYLSPEVEAYLKTVCKKRMFALGQRVDALAKLSGIGYAAFVEATRTRKCSSLEEVAEMLNQDVLHAAMVDRVFDRPTVAAIVDLHSQVNSLRRFDQIPSTKLVDLIQTIKSSRRLSNACRDLFNPLLEELKVAQPATIRLSTEGLGGNTYATKYMMALLRAVELSAQIQVFEPDLQ